jgi:hypothetical protein
MPLHWGAQCRTMLVRPKPRAGPGSDAAERPERAAYKG